MVFQPFDRFIFGAFDVVGKSRSICHDTKVTLGQANDRSQEMMQWLILLKIKFCKNLNVLFNSKCYLNVDELHCAKLICWDKVEHFKSNHLFFVLSRLWHPVTVIRWIQKANKLLYNEPPTQMLSSLFIAIFLGKKWFNGDTEIHEQRSI